MLDHMIVDWSKEWTWASLCLIRFNVGAGVLVNFVQNCEAGLLASNLKLRSRRYYEKETGPQKYHGKAGKTTKYHQAILY